MLEIDRGSVTRWREKAGVNALPININVDCPSCGKSLVNSILDFSQGYNQEIYHARVTCMACQNPAHFFVVNWSPANDTASQNARIFIDPSPAPSVYLPSNIKFEAFSPRFLDVYRQAAEAEAAGLNELVGMGYRKALEMLITDYLIAQNPDKRSDIARATLSKRIERYIDTPQLQRAAKHATWLGNDETHYERLHPDASIDDLKKFLYLTLDWISMEAKAKSLDEAAALKRGVV